VNSQDSSKSYLSPKGPLYRIPPHLSRVLIIRAETYLLFPYLRKKTLGKITILRWIKCMQWRWCVQLCSHVIPNGPVCVNFGGTWTNFVLCLWLFPVESLNFCLEMRRLKFPHGELGFWHCCSIPGLLLSRCPNILVYCNGPSGVLDVWDPFWMASNFTHAVLSCQHVF